MRRRLDTLVVLLLCSAAAAPLAAAEPARPAPASLEQIFSGGIPKSITDLQAMERRQRELAEKVRPCTVAVRLGAIQGSGVIVSKDGYVLTAAHVAGQPNRPVWFFLPDGRRIRGKTLGLNRGMDAGLMKIDETIVDGKPAEWPFVEISDSRAAPGQWCLATGHPGGFESGRDPVLRVGRVLSIKDDVLVTDCKLVAGDSGGPLFDMQGRVIGIHSRIGNALTSNQHVTVATYHEDWDRLDRGEAWGHLPGTQPYIGVQGDESKAARIERVFARTPADKAGIRVGDIITGFAGERVTDFASLKALVENRAPGDVVKLQIRRGEETLELEVTIGDALAN